MKSTHREWLPYVAILLWMGGCNFPEFPFPLTLTRRTTDDGENDEDLTDVVAMIKAEFRIRSIHCSHLWRSDEVSFYKDFEFFGPLSEPDFELDWTFSPLLSVTILITICCNSLTCSRSSSAVRYNYKQLLFLSSFEKKNRARKEERLHFYPWFNPIIK